MNKQGFTLLEVLLAMSVLAVVVAMLSLSLGGSLRVFEGSEQDEQTYTMAQIALERIAEDVAGAFVAKDCSFTGETALESGHRADTLDFCSQAHLVFNPQKQKNGPARLRYKLDPSEQQDESYRLMRSDQLLLPVEEGREPLQSPEFILADSLRSFQLTYFDSTGQEFDNWHGEVDAGQGAQAKNEQDASGPLPAAVHCILEFWADAEHSSTVLFSTRVVVPVGVGNAP